MGLTTIEAATLLDVCSSTIYLWERRGRLKRNTEGLFDEEPIRELADKRKNSMSILEAAKYLKVNHSVLYYHIIRGHLEPVSNKPRRYAIEDIETMGEILNSRRFVNGRIYRYLDGKMHDIGDDEEYEKAFVIYEEEE